MKPADVTFKPKTETQVREEMIDQTKKTITNYEEALKTATADMKKTFEKLLDQQKKQLEDFQKPDNKMIPMMAKGEQQQYEALVKSGLPGMGYVRYDAGAKWPPKLES